MKWVFLLALLGLIPVLTALLRSNPKYLSPVCFLIGLGMFVLIPRAWTAPVAWPQWPGPVPGLMVNLIDSVAVSLILSTKPVRIPGYVTASFALFCLALLISSITAYQREPVIFYVFQLCRTALLLIAIARVCATAPQAPVALTSGLGLGLVYEAILAVYQYHSGDARPGGNLGHSNFLGLASDFVIAPTMALLLGTRRTIWPGIVLLAGFAIAIVGGSRATLGLYGAGLLLVMVFSLWQRVSPRKMAFGCAGVLFVLVAVPVVVFFGNHRTEASIQSSDAERDAMKSAAGMMIADHPLGVGANQYVLVANVGGYSERAGVPWNADERAAPVHDTYYLIAAETGILGLIGFIAVICSFVWLGFRGLRGQPQRGSNNLLPGLLAAVIVVSVHVSFEWVFMSFEPHYLFAVTAGLMVAVAAETPRRAKRRSLPTPDVVAPAAV